MEGSTGWSAYERMVLGKLEEQSLEIAELREQVTLLRIDFAQQKVKAGLWGGIAGLLPGLIGIMTIFTVGVPGAGS